MVKLASRNQWFVFEHKFIDWNFNNDEFYALIIFHRKQVNGSQSFFTYN